VTAPRRLLTGLTTDGPRRPSTSTGKRTPVRFLILLGVSGLGVFQVLRCLPSGAGNGSAFTAEPAHPAPRSRRRGC